MLKKVLKNVLLVILLGTRLFADECKVSHKIMYGIASMERHPKRDIGYPYLISFNKKANMSSVKDELADMNLIILDNRTVDCKNEISCLSAVKLLLIKNIKNFDLGAYQIANLFHNYPLENYFDLLQSYADACQIIEKNINRYGNSWKSIAKYHSYRSTDNHKYRMKLQKILQNIYPELDN